MTRPIKFRAWDKVHNKMHVNVLTIDVGFSSSNTVYLDGNDNYLKQGDYELMQFTGLLDKNGKEIYEGDILRANGVILEVHWHVSDARLGLNMLYAEDEGNHIHSSRVPLRDWNWCATGKFEGTGENRHFVDTGYGVYLHGDNRKLQPCEVIGNIYSNPELVK